MKATMKGKVLALLLIVILGVFTGCQQESESFRTIEDFAHAKIGVLTGSSQELIAKEKYPEAQRVYFSRPADMVLAVEQGKIDCYMFGSPFLAATIWENANVKRMEQAVAHGDIAFAFPRSGASDPLREQLNAFLKQAKEDGTLRGLEEKWLGSTEPTEHPDYDSLTGENGTIRLAAVAENKPLIYQHKDRCTGYEMELLTLFARQYGYRFQVEVVPFESVIIGMATGKYDMTSASLQITEERSESVNFSDPYMQFDVVLVVKDGEDTDVRTAQTLEDLKYGTIAVETGTIWDEVAARDFPNAVRKNFSVTTDMILALQQGKVDACFTDKTVYTAMSWENAPVRALDESIGTISNALILAKDDYDPVLLEQINAFVAASKEDGTLEALSEKWLSDKEPEEHPDYHSLTGEKGTLKVAVESAMKPVSYQKNGSYTGYEVEFMTKFAASYGYSLVFEGMSFNALIPSVASGKCDIGASGISVTEERAESVTFAEPHLYTEGVAAVYCAPDSRPAGEQTIRSLRDVENGRIAILTGTIWDGVAKEEIPDAERKYYSTMADMLLSLEQGKVDALLGDRTFYVNARWENVPVTVLEETVGSIFCGFMLAKDTYDPVLLRQLNEFIDRSKEDGTLEALSEKWLSDREPEEHPDYRSLTGENGTLKVAVDDTSKPMTYQRNDTFTGFDVDLLTQFARVYGYRLDIEGMSFDGLIPSVASGKFDIAACGTAITPERAESVTFTQDYLEVDGVVIVSESTGETSGNLFLDKVSESFEKTFIREDRWKLIVQGVGITLLISISAAAVGTGLGFGLYLLTRSDSGPVRLLAAGAAKVYSRIVAGTPVVVILMILFYVIFGKIRNMSGIVVAIIGFSLTFGAFVYSHMAVSVGSVDRGQTEAAYSLGYTKNKTFFRIILPQAMKIFLPTYCGQAVDLIKATAVVGYIAVNDLTKMGDIIRSNTYEAFFPLIATALIYFILTWLIALLLNAVERHFEPQHRSKDQILKGLKTK